VKSVWHRMRGFSLVELTLSLGVAAFCLVAVFGLIPVGVQTNRNATSQTTATNIIASIAADLRGALKTSGTWTGTSPLFCIPLGTSKTMYFERESRCAIDVAGTTSCLCGGGTMSPTVKTRYRATVTFPSPVNFLTYANVKVTWPAEADPTTTTPSGSVEMLVALDRN
jgi:type II secretory pathway pseudopilin PulG